jgi:hypothetical protein
MLTILVAYFIAGAGAYFLTQKFNRWIALIPLAVVLAIVSSIASNTVSFFVVQGFIDSSISSAFYTFQALKDMFKNIIPCLFFIWIFRRLKLKAAEKKSIT